MIEKLAFVLSLTFATATMAADMTCNASLTEKKLAGAAKTSFSEEVHGRRHDHVPGRSGREETGWRRQNQLREEVHEGCRGRGAGQVGNAELL